MKSNSRRINVAGYLPLAILLLAGAAVSYAEESSEPRINTTSQGQGIQRGKIGAGSITTTDEFEALATKGERRKSTRSADQQKPGSGVSKVVASDFWFFDADVELFSDFDQDGYYYGIDLLFDVDTVFTAADVYAVIYLSLDLGPWNEYAVTEDFTVNGASSDDEYVVVSELVSGYPTGNYDILIEIWDTFDGSLVATFGPDNTSELSLLPLEDMGRDSPADTQIVISSGGGGSLGWIALLMLLVVAASARFSRRSC